MKKLALFWLIMLLYPLTAFISAHYQTEPADIITLSVHILNTQLSAFAAYAISFILYSFRINNKLTNRIIMILTGSAMCAVFSFFTKETMFIVLMFASFVIGACVFKARLSSCISAGYLIASLAVSAVLITLLRYAGAIEKNIFSELIIMADTFIYIILSNRKNVDGMMESRNYNKKYLPVMVRKNNIRFSLIFCFTALALMIFISPVSSGLSAILNIIKKMLNRALPDTQYEEEELPPDSNISEIFQIPEDQGNGLLMYIIAAATVIFFIILIISNSDLILNWISGCLSSTSYRIKKFFTDRIPAITDQKNDGFTDIVEDIDNINDSMIRPHLSERRILKRSYDEFRKMPPGNEKYRSGYKLILNILNYSGAKINASDTPDERAETINESSFTDVTETYDIIRYGNGECSGENIEHLDKTIMKYRKNVR